jgi:hypothetical protein
MRGFVLPLLLAGAVANAQQPPAPPPPCSAPEHRQFDFWLGEWEVTGGPKLDRIVGHNTIRKVSSGCALAEHWVNAGGRDGHSLNAYDAEARQWTQFWIGSDGVVLRLAGGLRGKAMEMEGRLRLTTARGGEQWQRIRWIPQDDGSVQQHWQTSDDAGNTWQTSFLGIYRRKPAAVAG